MIEPVLKARQSAFGGEALPPVGAVEPPTHLGLVLALRPVSVVLQTHEAGKRTSLPDLHRPQPEPPFLPVTDELRDLLLALLASQRARQIPHDLRVGTHTGVGVEVLVPPRTQEQPGGLYLECHSPRFTFSREPPMADSYSNPCDQMRSRS